MNTLARLASTALAVSSLAQSAGAQPSAARPPAEDDAVYQVMAKQFLAEYGYAEPGDFEIDAFLTDHFLRARLGLYDLHIPVKSMGDGSNAKDFKEISQSLLDLQETWLEWTAPGAERAPEVSEDLDRVRRWVKSWGPNKLRGAAAGDLLIELGADGETKAAAERFSAFMARGGSVGLHRKNPKMEPIVLIPERGSYVRSVALAGLMNDATQRAACWSPACVVFNEHYYGRAALFLPLQYADPAATLDSYERGSTMNWRSGTGLRQQVSQIASNVMLDNIYGARIPPSIVGAISLNIVIELFGECNTRVDGDLRARRTEAYEFFVPGGRSEGGRLPPNMADSRWREHGSEDRFARILKDAQKSGGKKARSRNEKLRSFQLQGLERIQKAVVQGPFLGSAAGAFDVPDELYGDKLEFLRAYRCAFMHFLRTEALKKAKDSAAAFAGMLRTIAALEEGPQIEAAMAEAYGATALSTAALEKTELEARFLEWIAKQ